MAVGRHDHETNNDQSGPTVSNPERPSGLPYEQKGCALDSIVGSGTMILGALVQRSVIGSNVILRENARVSDSILMDSVNVGENAVIQRAIIDKDVVHTRWNFNRTECRRGSQTRFHGYSKRNCRHRQGRSNLNTSTT